MGYEFYNMVSVRVIFGGVFISILVQFSVFRGRFKEPVIENVTIGAKTEFSFIVSITPFW